MKPYEAVAAKIVAGGARFVPSSVLRRVEVSAQYAQGKGWGSSTCHAEVRALLTLLPPDLRRDPVVLDVGANVGDWSDAMLQASPRAVIHAFEPSLSAFASLTARFARTPNVSCVRTAVSDHPGIGVLYSDRPGSGLASLTKRNLDHRDINFSCEEDVAIVTIDEWCDGVVKPVIIKLDVEGHELDCLRGAPEALETCQVVQFEFGGTNIDTRTYFHDFFCFFQDRGFQIHRLGPKGLRVCRRYVEQDECFTTTNYFAVRSQ